jgi:glycerol-3-phosphate dehydrogenase
MAATDQRSITIQKFKETQFDVLIIGGGVTGAGIALDAASRGLSVGLVEMNDFASGTSSKSTKLIHGGLRYLKQFEIALVREVGRERAIVHKLCPHLVVPEKMLLPLYEDGTFGKFATSVGLWVYDFLADVAEDDKRKMLSREETIALEPLLKKDKLNGGGFYAEYRTDDARLTIEIIKKAMDFGACVLNYTKATDFLHADNGRLTGLKLQDGLSGEEFHAKAKKIVSAAGPWVDEVRQKDGELGKKKLFLSKGVHIVVPHEKLPVKNSIYFDVDDGRMVFAIPRWNVTYVGTTDTPYSGDKNHVTADEADVNYLLEACNKMFPEVHLTPKDLSSSWAGLRPLIFEEDKSASEMSRKDEFFFSENGLISIAGGKLTGYRKMAERTVDVVLEKLKEAGTNLNVKSCFTDKIPLGKTPVKGQEDVAKTKMAIATSLSGYFEKPEQVADYLVSNYGKQAKEIIDSLRNKSVDQRTLLQAEIDFTIQNELVLFPLDFINRRSGRLYFNLQETLPHIEFILKYFAAHFEWDPSLTEAQGKKIEKAIQEAQVF